MFSRFFIVIFLHFCISTSLFGSAIEPYQPSVVPASLSKNAYQIDAGVILSEKYSELPLSIRYGIYDNLEFKFRWGVISKNTSAGISDLKFSLKYNFFEKTDELPCVFIESGLSLPTADHFKKLGTGSVGISFGGYLIKELDPRLLDFFIGLAVEFNDVELLPDATPPRIFSYRAGAKRKINQEIDVSCEIKGFNNYWRKPRDFAQQLYLAPSVSYNVSYKTLTMPLTASLLIGLTENSKKVVLYLETNF